MTLETIAEMFPGLIDGESEVEGADLVQAMTGRLAATELFQHRDARLIAAAPFMLKSLYWIRDCPNTPAARKGLLIHNACTAAIEKATK